MVAISNNFACGRLASQSAIFGRVFGDVFMERAI
jgi:hypothetical protein